jgi:hypothetical protein
MLKSFPAMSRRAAPWTPFQRRTWLTDQRRQARVQSNLAALLPAPGLSAVYPDKLAWDWDLPNPYKWNVWLSLDGGASYILPDGYWMYGDQRQFSPDGGGELHFIVGVDELGREITERSNSVRPDDAPSPIFLGFPDDGVSSADYDMTANALLLHFNGDLADTSGNGLDVVPYDGGTGDNVRFGNAADIFFDPFLGQASAVNFNWAGGRSEINPDWTNANGTTVIFWLKISYADTPADDGFNQPIISFCNSQANNSLLLMGGIPFETNPAREPFNVTLNFSHGTFYGICEFSLRKFVWNQVAMVSLDGDHQLFVNGLLTAESITEVINSDSGLRFGGWYDDSQMTLSPAVELAEFAVFSRAMAADELAAIYQLQSATSNL